MTPPLQGIPLTREDDELIMREWEAGTPASAIGAMMNPPRSKNSVLGRAHRLGLPKRAASPMQRVQSDVVARKPTPPRAPAPPRAHKSTLPPLPGLLASKRQSTPLSPKHVSKLEAEMHIASPAQIAFSLRPGSKCNWPYGDKPVRFECSVPCAVVGDHVFSYCAHHAEISYLNWDQVVERYEAMARIAA